MDLCDYTATRTQSGSCYLDTVTFLNPDCILSLTVPCFNTAAFVYFAIILIVCLRVSSYAVVKAEVSSLLP